MDALKLFELILVIGGVATTCRSVCWCCYFMHTRHGIGRSLAWVLLVLTLATTKITVLATLSLFNILDQFSPTILLSMRSALVIVIAAATIHLAAAVRKIIEETDNHSRK